jgi:hypothetical protein
MAGTPDRRLSAATDALRSLPLEQRMPGFGYAEVPGKAKVLEFLETDPHEWIRDPERRGEGLTCRWCGLTEAEAEALPRTAATCWRSWMADR